VEREQKIESKRRSAHERFGILSYVISNISKNRWRTILTVIGIAVPIAFFVLFSAMGDGLDEFINSQSTALNRDNYVEMSKIVRSWTNVLVVIIAIMIVINIANTMLISVSRRTYDFGILRALGVNQGQIVYLILLEAVIISTIALFVGIIIGFWGAIGFDYMFSLDQGAGFFFEPAKININSIINASILTLLIGTITALFPAIKASTISPIDTLRCE
jgi:putative ABC transport system permease protein